ncbi:MAG: serine/threonine protein phosphatase [Thermodesulfovibrio sp.]|nr:serine/threonine protein phosphatase [Thermodesulfovibrio sp.]
MHLEVLYNPDSVISFEPEKILEIFVSGKEILSKEPPFLNLEAQTGEVIFIGDTHGDFSTTKYLATRFLKNSDTYLIFLGDYIDREPEPGGSLFNLLYLCLLKIYFPDRVFLLKGNHEAHYSVFCYPYEFEENLMDIFGSNGFKIHNIVTEFFKEIPLMLKTENGIIASHSGFPMHGQSIDDKSRKDLIIDILWADADMSPMFRGYGIPKFTEKQLNTFLNSIGANCFIRGHDPYLAGKIVYSKRCLTLFTSRTYASLAGIKIARGQLSNKIANTDDIILEDITSYLSASE